MLSYEVKAAFFGLSVSGQQRVCKTASLLQLKLFPHFRRLDQLLGHHVDVRPSY